MWNGHFLSQKGQTRVTTEYIEKTWKKVMKEKQGRTYKTVLKKFFLKYKLRNAKIVVIRKLLIDTSINIRMILILIGRENKIKKVDILNPISILYFDISKL